MKKLYIFRNEGTLALNGIREKTNTTDASYDTAYQKIWASFLEGLMERLKYNLDSPDLQLEFHTHPIEELHHQKQKHWNEHTVLSLDSYVQNTHAYKFGVSRIFDRNGSERLRVGNRPGYPTIEAQLELLSKELAGKKIILDEDDIFTGGTLRSIVVLLHEHGIRPVAITAGIQVADTVVADPPIIPMHKYDPAIVHELSDPRDFLFGSYEGGLVLEVDGVLVRAPYIAPFVDIHQRAGIPADRVADFSKSIIDANKQFFAHIERLIHRKILLQDLSNNFNNFMRLKYDMKESDPLEQVFLRVEAELALRK